MKIKAIIVGAFEVNCYIIWGQSSRAIVIDPGAEADVILAFLERERLDVAVYLATHGHIDHISALAALAMKRPAPISMHKADARWAFSASNQMPPDYPVLDKSAKISRSFEGEPQWKDAGLVYSAILTPGHSPGSCCFYFQKEKVLFSGDTLFCDSVGRTDLPGGDSRLLTQSLRKLAQLPPATRIYPGHGPETTLATELKSNPYMN